MIVAQANRPLTRDPNPRLSRSYHWDTSELNRSISGLRNDPDAPICRNMLILRRLGSEDTIFLTR